MKFREYLKETTQPKDVKSIWDNGGESADRYSIVLKSMATSQYNDILGLSDNPTHPQGFSQFTSGQEGKHLGKKLTWNKLPPKIQKHIVDRLTESINESTNELDLKDVRKKAKSLGLKLKTSSMSWGYSVTVHDTKSDASTKGNVFGAEDKDFLSRLKQLKSFVGKKTVMYNDNKVTGLKE